MPAEECLRSAGLDWASAAFVTVAKVATRQDVRHRRRIITSRPKQWSGQQRSTATQRRRNAATVVTAARKCRPFAHQRPVSATPPRVRRRGPHLSRVCATFTPRRARAPRMSHRSRAALRSQSVRSHRNDVWSDRNPSDESKARDYRSTITGSRRAPHLPGPPASNTPATGAPQVRQLSSTMA